MADKIYELYKENKDRDLDDKFINNAFEAMLEKEPELNPYVKDFIITDEEIKKMLEYRIISWYSLEDKRITINRKAMEEQKINQQLYTLYTLKHELEHAKNLKKLYERRNDLESLIINYSLTILVILERICVA